MKKLLLLFPLISIGIPAFAEIDDPQVVAFANNKARKMAEHIYSAYYSAKIVLQAYNSGAIGSKIDAAGAGNLISDGSANDGRTRITGGDIYNLITACEELIDYVEGNAVTTANRVDVITKPHVNHFIIPE